MSRQRASRFGGAAASVAVIVLLTTGCAGTPAPEPLDPPAPPAAAVEDATYERIDGGPLSPGAGGDDADSVPRADEARYLDAAEAALMWWRVARYAPPDSPYARARSACIVKVRPRLPTDAAASLTCVPPYVWRFLRDEEAERVPLFEEPGDLMRR